MPLHPKKILISRTDNIGDLILTLPLAGYLKSIYPSASVGVLCRSYGTPLLRRCKHIDQVVEIEQLSNPVEYFAESECDMIIFAFPDKRLAFAAKEANIRYRIGTTHRLYHWYCCNLLAHFSRLRSGLHEAQLNFCLLRPLGINFIPSLSSLAEYYGLDANVKQKILPDQYFNLILHPKSNGNGREWPICHYVELTKILQENEKIICWITGSASEGGWIQEYAPELFYQDNVRNLCGQLSLDGLIDTISSADGLIASGTGPLHLAAALGKPTLGLFPPFASIDPGRWAPLGSQAQYLCKKQSCRICKGSTDCQCMKDISPSTVAAVVLLWQGTNH